MMFGPLIDQVLSAHFLPLMGACHSVLVPGTQRHCCENAHFEKSTLKEENFFPFWTLTVFTAQGSQIL